MAFLYLNTLYLCQCDSLERIQQCMCTQGSGLVSTGTRTVPPPPSYANWLHLLLDCPQHDIIYFSVFNYRLVVVIYHKTSKINLQHLTGCLEVSHVVVPLLSPPPVCKWAILIIGYIFRTQVQQTMHGYMYTQYGVSCHVLYCKPAQCSVYIVIP